MCIVGTGFFNGERTIEDPQTFWGSPHWIPLRGSQSPTSDQSSPVGPMLPLLNAAQGSAPEKELVEDLLNLIFSPEPNAQNYIVRNSFALYKWNCRFSGL